MLLEVSKSIETGGIICYVIEYTGKDSTIAKYEISKEFVGGIKYMAKNDFWYRLLNFFNKCLNLIIKSESNNFKNENILYSFFDNS